MEKHIVKILAVGHLTHNVKRFVVEKPAGYEFIPGQATDVAINRPGWTDQCRPFTFTSVPDADFLEFTIKIYTGHNGVTEQLAKLGPGDELLIHEVFGAIAYHGPGVFIAGGAGVTPFIAIFRQLKKTGLLAGNTLLFANHSPVDIILKDELTSLLGKDYIDIIRNGPPGISKKVIDKDLLAACIGREPKHFYICGPDEFTTDMVGLLHRLGIENKWIVIEH
ncbi:flavodoxin reductase [Mucilaginibacter aquariorum]|uniref:Flavodoxin reductase n=1 Tax=Mucilaginibacter aquariorum TaxID=2967225 RepID=A0ABT1T263_9SPHI|nr:flavodoxin reductase [Mucilaginibacter aquariorum]MCQ6958371.1 flavodoxin reductase [Mucilaginibacter aquariorum]